MSESPTYIAVVDDEPSVCKAFERLLRGAKFEVVTFGSGADFLSSLKTRTPECVVLDLHMPGVNGFDVQSHLAGLPETKIGVVIVTGHDSPVAQERTLAGGAVAYLRKPVDARPLLDAVRTAIATRTS